MTEHLAEKAESGRPERPLADRVEDLLGDLHERLHIASIRLQELAQHQDTERLNGKREGVLIAQDYLRFTIRNVRALIEEASRAE